MGTVVTIDLYGGDGRRDDEERRRHRPGARAILHEADEMFSTWKDESPLSRLRRGEITLDQVPARGGRGPGALPDGPGDLPRVVRSVGHAGRRRPDGLREGVGGTAGTGGAGVGPDRRRAW